MVWGSVMGSEEEEERGEEREACVLCDVRRRQVFRGGDSIYWLLLFMSRIYYEFVWLGRLSQ